MEPATRSAGPHRVSMIPAKMGWSDIGSWAAVHELLAEHPGANVSAGESFTLDATGNYFYSQKKFVAAIGVTDLVLVETDDALLLCSRERSQDVGKIVKWLEEKKLSKLAINTVIFLLTWIFFSKASHCIPRCAPGCEPVASRPHISRWWKTKYASKFKIRRAMANHRLRENVMKGAGEGKLEPVDIKRAVQRVAHDLKPCGLNNQSQLIRL